MNLEEKIINKIKEEKIQPRSVWYFLARDYSLWSLVFVSVVLAGFSFAPIIFIIQNLELGYIKHISNNIYLFILSILPYPSIILCLLTTYLSTLAWERTAKGYKFDGKKVFTVSFLISLILGIFLNLSWNLGKLVDDDFRQASFGNYRSFEQKRNEFWFKPAEGRILGNIKNISTSSFELSNEQNNFAKEINFDDTVIGKENIIVENNVRVVGFEEEATDSPKIFIACIIFPDNFKDLKDKKERPEFKNKPDRKNPTSEASNKIHEECKTIFQQGRAYFHPAEIK
jgi:hypothetical protein